MIPRGVGPATPVGVLSKVGIAAATLGRADAVRYLIPNQMRILGAERPGAYRQGALLANRLSLREGHHALDAESLGRASEALHMALLQSNPPSPGKDPVLRLFPAWPKQWDASYKLAARGAFIVTASVKAGEVRRVTIHSQAGAVCRLRNPWGAGSAVTLRRDNGTPETIRGDLLELPTVMGETLVLERAGAIEPASVSRSGVPDGRPRCPASQPGRLPGLGRIPPHHRRPVLPEGHDGGRQGPESLTIPGAGPAKPAPRRRRRGIQRPAPPPARSSRPGR